MEHIYDFVRRPCLDRMYFKLTSCVIGAPVRPHRAIYAGHPTRAQGDSYVALHAGRFLWVALCRVLHALLFTLGISCGVASCGMFHKVYFRCCFML